MCKVLGCIFGIPYIIQKTITGNRIELICTVRGRNVVIKDSENRCTFDMMKGLIETLTETFHKTEIKDLQWVINTESVFKTLEIQYPIKQSHGKG